LHFCSQAISVDASVQDKISDDSVRLESLVTVKKQVRFKVSQKARARRIWTEKTLKDFSFLQIF
jgi:hypothetical protein